MEFREAKYDVFQAPEYYHLAHCISADAEMGMGIAVKFVRRFPEITILRTQKNEVGTCKKVGRIFNLITKEKYNHKPTYKTMENALFSMRKQCENEKIMFLAMPQIGCGLDKLQWSKVRQLIIDVFTDMDIKIVACEEPESSKKPSRKLRSKQGLANLIEENKK